IAFSPFARDANKTYDLIAAAVGTSDEYANQPSKYRDDNYRRITVYVGNELEKFDTGAIAQADAIEKPDGELWIIYAGTLGASYDIATLIDATVIAARENPSIRVKILGDGPDRAKLEEQAARLNAPVDFVGYAPYELMAAYLKASDITVNSLVKSAPQSIITKIGDYLAAGIPMINTGSSPEFRAKVETDGFGVNVEAEDAEALAKVLVELANDDERRQSMGDIARRIAEEQFDQPTSYQAIVKLIRNIIL
ncbi:MAG: glycosyltransferase, partial [Eggerthellaceae bacterium]|nr:glycosyltransferase [Eggerthellaceae bacterium]